MWTLHRDFIRQAKYAKIPPTLHIWRIDMIKRAYTNMVQRHEWLVVSCLLILGFFLRVYAIGTLPYGLNQDEASSLYEAWSLLRSGIDRNGNAFPVLLVSWGSGQNALLSDLAIPFVALLGPVPLAIRLPGAILSCVGQIGRAHV